MVIRIYTFFVHVEKERKVFRSKRSWKSYKHRKTKITTEEQQSLKNYNDLRIISVELKLGSHNGLMSYVKHFCTYLD